MPDNDDVKDKDSKTSGDDASKSGDDNGTKPAPWSSEFGDQMDPERAWRTIVNQRTAEKELSGKVATIQEQLDDALKRVAQFEDAGKSDDERKDGEIKALNDAKDALERTNADLRVTLTETEIRYQIMLEAQKLEYGEAKQRFRDPAVVLKVIDRESLKLDKNNVPEDGEIARALKELAKSHPWMLESNGDVSTDGSKSRDKVPATRKSDDGKQLAQDEIDRRKQESKRKMGRLWG